MNETGKTTNVTGIERTRAKKGQTTMTKAEFFSKPTLIISMQYFADPDSGSESEQPGQDASTETKPEPTFDDMLQNKAYQSEFDKRVKQALEKQRTKLDADYKAQAAEAEKLAKMNAEEKAQHEREQREKALADREAAVTKRELKAEAKAQLTEKGLPAKLADVLDYSDADKCKASLESVSAAFSEAVQDAVNDRLRSKEPPKKGTENKGTAFDNMTFAEKCAYVEAHPNDPEVKAFLGK